MSASYVAGVVDPGRSQTVAKPGLATPATTLLAAWRAFAVGFFSILALIEIALIIPFVRRDRRLETRADWLHRWCRFACRLLGICMSTHGLMPRSGLLVCNHLSYLDVIALSSIRPGVFVAKRDVASWPLVGWLACAAGTIFADRERKLSASSVAKRMREAIDRGSLVILFPEGTSSDGANVLPFKSALLEPALQLGCPITVAAIDYSLPQGSVADEICYWRDMTLLPHLLNVFTKAKIQSRLSVTPFKSSGGDRKEIARALRDEIVSMRS
jgi:1-acyl-sn-glycerol-3-phosphate acyltransferase